MCVVRTRLACVSFGASTHVTPESHSRAFARSSAACLLRSSTCMRPSGAPLHAHLESQLRAFARSSAVAFGQRVRALTSNVHKTVCDTDEDSGKSQTNAVCTSGVRGAPWRPSAGEP
eukprot:6228440-Alexandrium_andersonii.AAC.1